MQWAAERWILFTVGVARSGSRACWHYNPSERGVAGIVAVTLAMPDPKSTIYATCIRLA